MTTILESEHHAQAPPPEAECCPSTDSAGCCTSRQTETRTDYDDETVVSFTPYYAEELRQVPVRYRWLGPVDAPVVVVQGGTSAGRRVASLPDETGRGWWQACVGRNGYVDTDRYRVLGLDWLTPTELPQVPAISSFDQAAAVAGVLAAHGVTEIKAHVGASYGGMVGLALAASCPDLAGQLIVISAGHKPHPMTSALRVIQRRIVELADTAPELRAQTLAIARALAVTTYRSEQEFKTRFAGAVQWSDGRSRLPVEDYLDAVGPRFVAAISPERFRALSESVDLHQVDPAKITTPTTLIGIGSDRLVPLADIRELARAIPAPAASYELTGLYGHDTFLKEPDRIGQIVQGVLR